MNIRRTLAVGVTPLAAFGIAFAPASTAMADTQGNDDTQISTTADEEFGSGEGLGELLSRVIDGGEFDTEGDVDNEGVRTTADGGHGGEDDEGALNGLFGDEDERDRTTANGDRGGEDDDSDNGVNLGIVEDENEGEEANDEDDGLGLGLTG